jgi:predicted kinase
MVRGNHVATLHLIVGLPCSGKTTLARQLETKYSALRLTTDEWHIRLFGRDYWEDMTKSEETAHDSRHESVESIMWDVAARVLVLGVDVVLDFGCWFKSQRDELRCKAENLGADFKIHFADVPEAVLFERLEARNEMHTEGTFFIPEAKLKEWLRIFEPPSSQELDSS